MRCHAGAGAGAMRIEPQCDSLPFASQASSLLSCGATRRTRGDSRSLMVLTLAVETVRLRAVASLPISLW